MNEAGALSGFRASLGKHADFVEHTTNASQVVTSITTSALLAQYDVPSMLGYVNLDIEGAELEVLETWPWHKHSIGVLTLEHNDEEPKRTQMRSILESHGMVLAYEVEHDDWYVHESLLGNLARVRVPKLARK